MRTWSPFLSIYNSFFLLMDFRYFLRDDEVTASLVQSILFLYSCLNDSFFIYYHCHTLSFFYIDIPPSLSPVIPFLSWHHFPFRFIIREALAPFPLPLQTKVISDTMKMCELLTYLLYEKLFPAQRGRHAPTPRKEIRRKEQRGEKVEEKRIEAQRAKPRTPTPTLAIDALIEDEEHIGKKRR